MYLELYCVFGFYYRLFPVLCLLHYCYLPFVLEFFCVLLYVYRIVIYPSYRFCFVILLLFIMRLGIVCFPLYVYHIILIHHPSEHHFCFPLYLHHLCRCPRVLAARNPSLTDGTEIIAGTDSGGTLALSDTGESGLYRRLCGIGRVCYRLLAQVIGRCRGDVSLSGGLAF